MKSSKINVIFTVLKIPKSYVTEKISKSSFICTETESKAYV